MSEQFWVDIGVNLAHASFDNDRSAVVEAAQNAGVGVQIITGVDVASSTRALELAAQWPGVSFATVGMHPHHADSMSAVACTALRTALRQPLAVAVGECGLDYFRDFSQRDAQRRAFEAQLELALECGKPVFLHQREAHEDFLAILKAHSMSWPRAVAHCFTGGIEELEDYLSLGLSIGVTGWLSDERRGAALAAAVPHIPSDRLMLETDAPYLLPRDLRPQPRTRRNEPKFLPHIARAVARVRGVEVAELARETSANALRFFSLESHVGESVRARLQL